MGWLVIVVLVGAAALCAVFGVKHSLEHKANSMTGTSEEDRRRAADLREIEAKIDHAKNMWGGML
ncbi:hypothetical protein [Bifidobacterium sp. ESL0732]|uniref:hypothetical protein n=1 Tax=Bifidobacterium sp. ESL0732 TaxID=2983222 RepID=UPI0023F758AA|nr:hypothetical protein [Bifidobacterium sp. ESL0732]WEV64804.1 hypothetical protein OZX70_04360 [Bifidobacterium sp. ESL0732]